MSDELSQASGSASSFQVEMHGVDIIADSDRKGKPSGLFWPWFAANISVLSIPYGAWLLGFGVSFAQACVAAAIGIVFSFLLCGIVAVAGKRGSAPTMVLSRAAFGVRGSRVASLLSWILTVGWETILTALAVMATATVFDRLGVTGGGTSIKVIALIVVAVLIVGGGVVGFDLIMKMQTWITIITGVLTIGYIALTFQHIDLKAVAAVDAGPPAALIGGLVFMMTGFGLGWVNMAADYSRYLPRKASGGGVVGWTAFGAAVAPLILVFTGLLLASSDATLSEALGSDPIGALTSILPTWYVVPFAIVAILGLVGGALLDIYSSGLALISTGLKVPRPVAAGIDGCIMVLGTIYIVFFASSFQTLFEGFLITLGVPMAAWAGIMIADIVQRRKDYDEVDLFRPAGRYGSVPIVPISLMAVGTGLGWGLVMNAYPDDVSWLNWEGYLLGLIGGKDGALAGANLGVLVAIVIGFVGTLALRGGAVRRQEALPPTDPASLTEPATVG